MSSILSAPPLFPQLLETLTGSAPSLDQVSAGFTGYTQHPPLQLRTKYYNANITIWCDEIPAPTSADSYADHAETSNNSSQTGNQVQDSRASDLEDKPSVLPIQVSTEHKATAHVVDVDSDAAADVDGPPSLDAWRVQMLSEPAGEVRRAIGGIILALPLERTSMLSTSKHDVVAGFLDIVEVVNELRDLIEEEGYGREVAAVILLIGSSKTGGATELNAAVEKLEEVLLEGRGILGWDIIGWDGLVAEAEPAVGRNMYGEKVGVERVKELLETVDWSAPGPAADGDADLGFLSSDEEDGTKGPDGIKLQGQELEREMMGLKLAMRDHGLDDDGEEDDLKIDQLPRLLERVVAIKEAGAEMSKSDREKFAQREMKRIMEEMD